MGLVFGKISVETPKYSVLDQGQDYEIREYSANLVAEVTYDPSETKRGNDGGFMMLADYIGALGTAQNVKVDDKVAGNGEKIAMTAPVITQQAGSASQSENIAMTAPVLTEEKPGNNQADKKMMTMQFVLPAKYTMATVPQPTNLRVVVKELAARRYGVLRFSGVADDKLVAKKLKRLRKAVEGAGYKVMGEHVLARYNPPWTIPSLRTNEVMLPVE